jgi:NADP-dependent 3-hydroxy acid dehydrogenase YdfG
MAGAANPLLFVTGASSGIGQALAMRFYEAGHDLALVARRTAEIEAWAAARQLDPRRWRVYGADVAEFDSIVSAGAACIEQQGLPDVVIANAGVSIGMDTAERSDLDVMARTFAINNLGLAATFHPFVAAMAAAAAWSASAASPRSAGCRATAPTARARPGWWPTAKACAAK